MKVILFAIVTIISIHQIKGHNIWKPSKDCLNGQIDAWKCCLGSKATIYLKHPKKCNMYYKCAYKHLELKLCHLGLHWSVEHQKCKKPQEAQCENTSATTTTTTPKPSQWQLPKGCYDGSVTVNECCKMSQKWYELLPDQNNCHKFYKCYKGKSYHLSCPPHFKWSDKKRKCVRSSHTGCDTKPTTTTESTLTTVAPGGLPNGCYDGSISSSKCCKMDVGKLTKDVSIESLIGENFDLNEISRYHHHSSSSEENIFHNELLADPKNCHKYYKCIRGKPLHLSCPYHTKWDIQSRKCIYALNSKCTDSETTTLTTTITKKTTTTITTTPAPWRLPDGCYDGSIKAKECCKIEMNSRDFTTLSLIGENFDLDDYRKHHSSSSSSSEETINWNNETLADPKDCHKYFQCKNGKPVHLSCPKNNKWNIELGKCIYSSSNKCTDADPTTKPTITTTESEITTSILETSTTPISTTTAAPWRLPEGCYDGSIKAPKCCKIKINETMDVSSSSNSKERQDTSLKSMIAENFDLIESTKHSGSKSSEEENNFNTESLADPKNCHKYFKCENGKPIHKSCPKHTKWNIELGQCVYAIYEKCSDPEPTTTLPLTTTEQTTTEEIPATTPYKTTSTELSNSTPEETTTTDEKPTTTDSATTSEKPTSPEETTTEAITTTEVVTSTSEKSTSTETVTTTEEPTTNVAETTTERLTTPEITTSAASTTTEALTTSENTTTEKTTVTTPEETTTEEITTSEIVTSTSQKTTSTEIVTTTEEPTSTEAITTTESFSTITTDIVTNTETSTSVPITSTTNEVATTTEATITTTEASTMETSSITTTEEPTTTEITTPTKTYPTTETTISTTEDSATITTIATTELPNNSTSEANTDPTPDPNGSCGTASYKCRHGIISAEECCKGVPYWEDRLLQNNDNCGTYFQCVHEVPQIRICPSGLYWNADVCRCEWKQLSTCNF